MICSVDGCDNSAMYKSAKLCQKHYFRLMRNGTTNTIRARKYRARNAAGYQLVFEPKHPLANKSGYVYEHRFVYFNEVCSSPNKCEICNTEISWDTLHIDHKDNDVTNNKPVNLRATCRPCNTFRGSSSASMSNNPIDIDGVVMSAEEWSRQEGVKVSGKTIRNRISGGMSAYDAVFSEKKTHKNSLPSKGGKIFDRLK